jgi:3D (Asp-Asp-Asp) domain-containing protein
MTTEPLGTVITISPAAFGRSRFVVLDRIGSGSQLDIYNPSCRAAIDYGRRTERVRVLNRGGAP